MIALLLSFILLVIASLAVVIAFKIPIDVTRFKEPLGRVASKALERSVYIDDSIIISTSLEPFITLKGVRIDNPSDFQTDTFMFMEVAKIQLELYPLLKKKINISEITVQGLDVTLEENQTGKTNWVFKNTPNQQGALSSEKTSQKETGQNKKFQGLESDSLVVRKLDFRDINIYFHKPEGGEPSRVQLASCLGSMVPGAPLHIDIDGKFLQHDYFIDISIASLEEFLTQNKSWVEIKTAVANANLEFSGVVNLATASKSLTMKMVAHGKKLSDLNGLVNLDLPPFKSYRVDAELHLEKDSFELQNLLISTGTSSLNGKGIGTREAGFITLDLQLHSPLFQIDDFVFDDWTWVEQDSVEDRISPQEINNKTTSKEDFPDNRLAPARKRILDPGVLAKFDCSLSLEADKVQSGNDFLGSGLLKASVKDGRIAISPLAVELPSGKITMSASVKPGADRSEAELKVDIENFDIGVLVRRSKPQSDMGGQVNLDLDLRSIASTIPDLLDHGNGYLDFSGKLENFGAGIIDLWAVNLIAAIISSTGSRSQLNCAFGRWTAKDGLLQSDVFFIDTSKVRICAKGQVDFTKNRVDLVVHPKAKKAEFFSLATPLEVHGTFSDLNVGVRQGGIVTTAVRFITSPVTVPLTRAFRDRIPKSGSDVCGIELGPIHRSRIEVPLCTN